jgi:hypothetical protein
MKTVRYLLAGLLIVSLMGGTILAQTLRYPEPSALPDQLGPEEIRAVLLEERELLCQNIEMAANILMKTGTLADAIPIVMEMTGMSPAEIEAREAAVCRTDPSDLTPEQLRADNRTGVWLVTIHLAALEQVLPEVQDQ